MRISPSTRLRQPVADNVPRGEAARPGLEAHLDQEIDVADIAVRHAAAARPCSSASRPRARPCAPRPGRSVATPRCGRAWPWTAAPSRPAASRRVGPRIDPALDGEGGAREAAIGEQRPQLRRQREIAQAHRTHHVVDHPGVAVQQSLGERIGHVISRVAFPDGALPPPASSGPDEAAKRLFDARCALCHNRNHRRAMRRKHRFSERQRAFDWT